VKGFRLRGAVVSAATAALIVVVLVVQDQRHGWPFSRHHMVQASLESAASRETLVPSERSAAARVAIQLPAEQLEKLGVEFEPVEMRSLDNPVRAVVTVVADESRITHVHTRVSGWLEQLYVNTTGQTVRAGQPLAAVFSQ
jgi:hypothetical protein